MITDLRVETAGDRMRVLVRHEGVWAVVVDIPRPFNADGTRVIESHNVDLVSLLGDRVVWAVETDGTGRGGQLYTIKATREEAIASALKLGSPADAVVSPMAIGAEPYDPAYMRVTRGNVLVGYESFAKPNKGD